MYSVSERRLSVCFKKGFLKGSYTLCPKSYVEEDKFILERLELGILVESELSRDRFGLSKRKQNTFVLTAVYSAEVSVLWVAQMLMQLCPNTKNR